MSLADEISKGSENIDTLMKKQLEIQMKLAKEQQDMPTARKKSITSRKELYIAFTHELVIT